MRLTLVLTVASDSGATIPRLRVPPNGTCRTSAAASTPGASRIRSSRSAVRALRADRCTERLVKSTRATETLLDSNPVSTAFRLRSVIANRTPPNRRSTEHATCVTTSTRRSIVPSRPPDAPRTWALIVSTADTREARQAGIRPNVRHVMNARLSMTPTSRQSSGRGNDNSRPSCPTRSPLKMVAMPTPTIDPPSASIAFSIINCRTRRSHDPPTANRTANSRSRAEARASTRLARFAHAINSTMAVVNCRITSGLE